jgi:hypothetical protein
MQCMEVSGAVRHMYVIRRLKVKGNNCLKNLVYNIRALLSKPNTKNRSLTQYGKKLRLPTICIWALQCNQNGFWCPMKI